jgi:hypothetical protein
MGKAACGVKTILDPMNYIVLLLLLLVKCLGVTFGTLGSHDLGDPHE